MVFNSSSDTVFILVPFPKNHFWLVIQETAETDPHPELLRNQAIHLDIKKKVPEMEKNAEHVTSSKEGYRKRSPDSLTSKHNWKKVNVYKQESTKLATAQNNRWEHDSTQCVKNSTCESKWDYKELQ